MSDTGAKHFGSHTISVGEAERPNMWVGFDEEQFLEEVERLCKEYEEREERTSKEKQ